MIKFKLLMARILGVGVDLCKVSRIQRIVTRNEYFHRRFLTGVFHPSEVTEFEAKADEQVKL
jgi:phosphopantetheinyl transferase (holo-ACP synthase)